MKVPSKSGSGISIMDPTQRSCDFINHSRLDVIVTENENEVVGSITNHTTNNSNNHHHHHSQRHYHSQRSTNHSTSSTTSTTMIPKTHQFSFMNENRYIKIADVPLSVTTVQLFNALAVHVDNGNANSSNGNTNTGNNNMDIYMSPVMGATTNNTSNKNTTTANDNDDDNGIIATTVSTDYNNGNGGNGDSYLRVAWVVFDNVAVKVSQRLFFFVQLFVYFVYQVHKIVIFI